MGFLTTLNKKMEQKVKDVTIYIATHNRTEQLPMSLDSVIAQTMGTRMQIVLSDNSDNDKTQKMYNERYKDVCNLTYIKREPMLPGDEHFNKMHDEVKSEYYMIFHDDDEMLPNMVEVLYNVISNDNTLIAVGGNSYEVVNGKFNPRKVFFPTINDEYIKDKTVLARKYVHGGICPYPAYMFRKSKMANHRLKIENGGKYCDTSFIISLLDDGVIKYVSKPLMKYNIHPDQDSKHHAFSQMLALIKYYKSIGLPQTDLNVARIRNIYNELVARGVHGTGHTVKGLQLFWKYSRNEYFVKYTIRLLGLYHG